MDRQFWLSSQHETSGRAAVIADEGESVWLYLTDRDGITIVADCWLFNRVPAPTAEELRSRTDEYRKQGLPPPATRDAADEGALLLGVLDDGRARIVWSRDGEGVAAWVDDQLAGFTAPGEKRGYSAHLRRESAWGRPLDLGIHGELFERPPSSRSIGSS